MTEVRASWVFDVLASYAPISAGLAASTLLIDNGAGRTRFMVRAFTRNSSSPRWVAFTSSSLTRYERRNGVGLWTDAVPREVVDHDIVVSTRRIS